MAQKAHSSGDKALARLHDSIDAAQVALKDVRSEMSRGSRELLADVETTLRDTRKNLRRVSRRVSHDLEDVQHAVTVKKTPTRRKSAQRKPAARTRSGGGGRRSTTKK